MPERKQMVHFCAKCGKEMSYKEKKMIYIYDVIHKKHFASSDFCPKKRMAINLCADCCYEIEKIICEWNSYRAIGTPDKCRAVVEEQKEIRNKAIDDFYESIVEAYKQMKSIPDIEKATLNTIAMGIRERLKEGGANE